MEHGGSYGDLPVVILKASELWSMGEGYGDLPVVTLKASELWSMGEAMVTYL